MASRDTTRENVVRRSTTRAKIRLKINPIPRVAVVEAEGTLKEAMDVGGSLTIPLHKIHPR